MCHLVRQNATPEYLFVVGLQSLWAFCFAAEQNCDFKILLHSLSRPYRFLFVHITNNCYDFQIYVPTNPHGAESLPPGIVVAESDFYMRRLWGEPSEVCFEEIQSLFIVVFVTLGRIIVLVCF